MNKKSTLILLSILHICILSICVLTIYNNKHSGATVAHVSSDTRVAVTPNEPEPMAEPEASAKTTEETEAQTEIQTETQTETEMEIPTQTQITSETETQYSFRYIGTNKNLNIRNTPSIDGNIIGKIPIGGCGSVLELTNENWMLIEYNDIVGYCSRNWIELQEITE